MKKILTLALLGGSFALAADPIAQIHESDVQRIEREILPLAQAMPADKYDFAPTNGTFTGVRTFGQQAKHLATVIYMCSAAVLQEKAPVDTGATDAGPDALKTKDQIVDYFKGAVAYAHKAMGSLTQKNELDQVPGPFGPGKLSRVDIAGMIGWHSYDHYGQMVVYARMNGVIPPASQPPPARAGKKGGSK